LRRLILLASNAVEGLKEGETGSCPDKLAQLSLPQSGAVTDSRAYGGSAPVLLEDDTVFLTRSGNEWKITAAGCTPRGERPYDCDVTGEQDALGIVALSGRDRLRARLLQPGAGRLHPVRDHFLAVRDLVDLRGGCVRELAIRVPAAPALHRAARLARAKRSHRIQVD